MMRSRVEIVSALLGGDRLMLVAGAWRLFSTGELIRRQDVEYLMVHPHGVIHPVGDQLPSFAPEFSQTWVLTPGYA